MKLYHGTNSIALNQILDDGFIRPLSKTNQQNICCVTTTMQEDVVYLTTERMFAGFYTPKSKRRIGNTNVYSCILEIDIPYEKGLFRPDEDYMNEVIRYNNYELYDKYIEPCEYEKYVDPCVSFFRPVSKEDIDFRYLFSINKELGLKILSETDPLLSLELGNIAYKGDISISNIKSVTIADILETTIYNLSKEEVNKAIQKVDISFVESIFNDIKL